MEKEWKTKRYASQIRARLETYVKPVIGHLPIADIGLAEIKQVLVPIWTNKRPTANRIRKHLEGAINWAIAEGHRTDESNPAEVKRLQFSLSFAERKVTHYPSLPYSEAPSFLAELRKQDGVKARALEFVMLTAVRVADICGGGKEHAVPMLWSHVDMPGQTLDHPGHQDGQAARRAAQRSSHDAARRDASRFRDPTTDFVFPGAKRGTVIYDATLRVSASGHGLCRVATTHGCRATFRTWASETTAFDKDVIETCLAHAQGELDSAYHRGSFLAKRRLLMAAWADFCGGGTIMQGAEVIELRR